MHNVSELILQKKKNGSILNELHYYAIRKLISKMTKLFFIHIYNFNANIFVYVYVCICV